MFWFAQQKPTEKPVTGLVLPGGGARNAYQVGVLKAIAELLPEDNDNPFPVITGTSSGAINATLLAAAAGDYRQGVEHLINIWENFKISKVFYADPLTAIKNGLHWAVSLATGGTIIGNPKSILNNQPLREMLTRDCQLENIQQAIDDGTLHAIGISASNYDNGISTCYYQGTESIIPWQRSQRRGQPTKLKIDHLMASIAIPLIFPSVKIHGEHHGDGSMRESAPLSPALHLGANRLLIIGIQELENPLPAGHSSAYPSIGKISGYVLDTLFMDSLNADVERLNRINLTIGETKDKRVKVNNTTLRPIEFLIISPSIDLNEMIHKHIHKAPIAIRILLRSLGALNREGHPLISYLLFEGAFCKELIQLGYEDGMQQRKAIQQLLQIPPNT